MERVRWVAVVIICCIDDAVGCTLDRNAYNPAPYMLKLVVKDKIMCHAALITQHHAFSCLDPTKPLYRLYRNFTFVADQFASDGDHLCSAFRKPYHKLSQVGPGKNTAWWYLSKEFKVTLNRPFMYTRLEDISAKHIKSLTNMYMDGANETCTLRVYADRSVFGTATKVGELRFLTDPVTIEYWRENYCKTYLKFHYGTQYTKCLELTTEEKFFADLGDMVLDDDWDWYQGAIMHCRGTAVGSLSKVLYGNPPNASSKPLNNNRLVAPEVEVRKTQEKVVMFESLHYPAPHLHKLALQWPKTIDDVDCDYCLFGDYPDDVEYLPFPIEFSGSLAIRHQAAMYILLPYVIPIGLR